MNVKIVVNFNMPELSGEKLKNVEWKLNELTDMFRRDISTYGNDGRHLEVDKITHEIIID
jgi:hypothetical protein